MGKEFINPAGVFKHSSFTRIVTVSGPAKLIFIAGQTPSDDAYQPVAPGDYRGQYVRIMENLAVQLAAAGAGWDDVTFKRTYTLDVDAYLKAVSDPGTPRYGDPSRQPPGTLLGVTRLSRPEFLIEIEIMAVVAE
jgi:enamine deaminase RidA (YjgF/YER057c/UK114 family)